MNDVLLFLMAFIVVNWKILLASSFIFIYLFIKCIDYLNSKTALDYVVIFLLIFFALLIPYKVIDWGFLSGENTAHLALCKNEVLFYHCNSPDHTLSATVYYKAIPDRQEVLGWVESDKSIEKLNDCAVKDMNNWSCKAAGGYREIGYTSGVYWTKPTYLEKDQETIAFTKKMYAVPRWKHLLLSVHESDNPNLQLLMSIIF
ncbi:hypothetical protein HY025_00755 [Candidatus Daviesbacteria bacterium]|nr:hypothetical protein [Candidatus Daviesbacteria bacterium]